ENDVAGRRCLPHAVGRSPGLPKIEPDRQKLLTRTGHLPSGFSLALLGGAAVTGVLIVRWRQPSSVRLALSSRHTAVLAWGARSVRIAQIRDSISSGEPVKDLRNSEWR